MKENTVFIIGGGASGMIAALAARSQGARVTILERNNRIGKKILATGNGRCNYTNVYANIRDYNHPEFVDYALSHFDPAKTMSFFQQLGIVPKVEKEGKAYPLSEQASSIVDVFLYALKEAGVEVVTDAYVHNVIRVSQGFTIYLEDGRIFDADKVIVATGGKAMPNTGSDGSGYLLAQYLGHTITPVFPAIVKLKLDSPYLKHLEGIKLPTRIALMLGEDIIQEEENDIIFGNYGISGPAVLDISRKANELLLEGHTPELRLTIVTALKKTDVDHRFEAMLDRPVDFSLVGLINKRYISALLKEAGVEKQNSLLKDLPKDQLDKIKALLFDWRFKIAGSKSFRDAQATAGGVSIQEIDPQSFESTLIPGMYFTGEVMDIDGRCGGFNLQWAWSSGYLAGYHAATGDIYD